MMHSSHRAVAVATLAVVLGLSLAGCRVAYTDTTGGGIDRTPVPIATTAPAPAETTAPEPTQAPPVESKPGSYETPILITGNTTLNFEALVAEHGAGSQVFFVFADRNALLSITGNSVLTVGESDGLRVIATDLGYDIALNGDDGWASLGSAETGDFLDLSIESE